MNANVRQLKRGEVWLTVVRIDGQQHVKIREADPFIGISDNLMSHIARGDISYFDYDWTSETVTFRDDFGAEYIYLLGDYLPLEDVWEARWPD